LLYRFFSSDNNARIDLRNQPIIKEDRKFEKYESIMSIRIYIYFYFYNRLQPISTHIAQLAMTSQILPQRAACALHLVYAIACGTKFLLNPEEYIDSLSTIFVQSECDVS
jgi:hypothetical protein